MVLAAGDFAREQDQSLQAKVTARARRYAEALPRRAAVSRDFPVAYVLFEGVERSTHHDVELACIERIELLLRIVEVVNVERGESEIPSAAVDLIGKKARAEAVPSGHDFRRSDDARTVVLVLEKAPISFLRCRWSAVERDIAALGADYDFVAPHASAFDRGAKRVANAALRTLTTVVDRSVEKIDATSQGFQSCRCISRVFRVVTVAQVGTHTEGGDSRSVSEWAIKMVGLFGRETPLEPARSLGRGAPIDERIRSFQAVHCDEATRPPRLTQGRSTIRRFEGVAVWCRGRLVYGAPSDRFKGSSSHRSLEQSMPDFG